MSLFYENDAFPIRVSTIDSFRTVLQRVLCREELYMTPIQSGESDYEPVNGGLWRWRQTKKSPKKINFHGRG